MSSIIVLVGGPFDGAETTLELPPQLGPPDEWTQCAQDTELCALHRYSRSQNGKLYYNYVKMREFPGEFKYNPEEDKLFDGEENTLSFAEETQWGESPCSGQEDCTCSDCEMNERGFFSDD